MSKKIKILFVLSFLTLCCVGCVAFNSDSSSVSDHGMMCPEGYVWIDD